MRQQNRIFVPLARRDNLTYSIDRIASQIVPQSGVVVRKASNTISASIAAFFLAETTQVIENFRFLQAQLLAFRN